MAANKKRLGVKNKQYSGESMKKAEDAVRNGQKLFAAAKEFAVPRKTLSDRVKRAEGGRVRPIGRRPLLSPEKEEALVKIGLYMQRRRYPMSKKVFLAHVRAIVNKCGANHSQYNPQKGPTQRWWVAFKRRHPELVWKTTDTLDRARIRQSKFDVFQKLPSVAERVEEMLSENVTVKEEVKRVQESEESSTYYTSSDSDVSGLKEEQQSEEDFGDGGSSSESEREEVDADVTKQEELYYFTSDMIEPKMPREPAPSQSSTFRQKRKKDRPDQHEADKARKGACYKARHYRNVLKPVARRSEEQKALQRKKWRDAQHARRACLKLITPNEKSEDGPATSSAGRKKGARDRNKVYRENIKLRKKVKRLERQISSLQKKKQRSTIPF